MTMQHEQEPAYIVVGYRGEYRSYESHMYLHPGTVVRVEGDRGVNWAVVGRCAVASELQLESVSRAKVLDVIHDDEQLQTLFEEMILYEQNLLTQCRGLVQQMNLRMRILGVETQLDRRKIVVYYEKLDSGYCDYAPFTRLLYNKLGPPGIRIWMDDMRRRQPNEPSGVSESAALSMKSLYDYYCHSTPRGETIPTEVPTRGAVPETTPPLVEMHTIPNLHSAPEHYPADYPTEHYSAVAYPDCYAGHQPVIMPPVYPIPAHSETMEVNDQAGAGKSKRVSVTQIAGMELQQMYMLKIYQAFCEELQNANVKKVENQTQTEDDTVMAPPPTQVVTHQSWPNYSPGDVREWCYTVE